MNNLSIRFELLILDMFIVRKLSHIRPSVKMGAEKTTLLYWKEKEKREFTGLKRFKLWPEIYEER